jgi:hypothetical protein
LRGGFVLLYPRRSFGEPGEKASWLLIKRRDEYADPSWKIDDPPLDRSVLTGRTLKEIEENRPAKRRAIAKSGVFVSFSAISPPRMQNRNTVRPKLLNCLRWNLVISSWVQLRMKARARL